MKLSIITINLNNRLGLERTIRSVVCQTFHDFEFIVIDGSSSDGSLDVIKKFSSYITYWKSEPDNGIYNAMNKGVKVARGEYCLFLNSADTLYDSSVLQKVFADNPQESILYGHLLMGNEVSIAEEKITLKNFLGHTIGHQSSFIKRTLLLSNPYDESLRIVSDWKFFFQEIVLHNVSCRRLNLLIAKFDLNGISTTHQILLEKEREKVLNEFFSPVVLSEVYKYFGIKDKYFELFVNIGDSSHKWRFYNIVILLLKIFTLNRGWVKHLEFRRNDG